MELCVGMICGTIPTLRPLIALWTKKSRKQGHYEMFESPHELAPTGEKVPNGPARLIFSILRTIKTQFPFFSRSIRQEGNTEAHELHQIRRTYEVEVNNEAAGNRHEGKGGYKLDWNPA